MTNPFTPKVWVGRTLYIHNAKLHPDVYFDIEDLILAPVTLLRTMIWVHFAGYSEYNIGDTGALNQPHGFSFGAVNGPDFNGNEPAGDLQDEFVDLIATGSTMLNYAALGWPPDTSGHLTGSVNDLASDATLATTENLNTFMYGNATIHVDSKAQRIFNENPRFKFVYGSIDAAGVLVTDPDVFVQVRMLFHQNR